MLEFRNIRLGFKKFSLNVADLHVDNEYFVLLGPSGAGKSLLIDLAAGLKSPDSGRIMLGGRDLVPLPPEQRKMGVVWQDYALFGHLNVRHNIAYGLKARGIQREEQLERIEKTAELAGIGHLLERDIATLSGGEQQRTALARALVIEPECLLLDEPLSSLDSIERRRLRRILKNMQTETGIPFFHVTHDLKEARELADRMGILADGELIKTGTTEECFTKPDNVRAAGFLGLKNIFDAQYAGPAEVLINKVTVHVHHAHRETGHIWIPPEEIHVARHEFGRNMSNRFEAEIVETRPEGHLVAVVLSAGGLELTAWLSLRQVEQADIVPGINVFLAFRPSCVHCF